MSDYRRLSPEAGLAPYTAQYLFLSLPNVLADTVPEALINSRTANVQLLFSNWSLFAQDTWKADAHADDYLWPAVGI